MKEPSIEQHVVPPEAPKKPRAKEQMKNAPDASTEDAKEVERFLDASLIELLEAHALRVNEGTNGVIFRLNINDVPQDLRLALKESEIDLEGEQAIKALKIYQPGKGRAEFEMQKKGYDIVEASGKPGLAQVPKPATCRDLKLTPQTIEALNRNGLPDIKDRVEVIIMDYVPGKDVATMLYEEVVKRHPALKDTIRDPERMSFDELFTAVSNALSFARPGGKAFDTADRAFEKNVVLQNNAKKVYDFLERSGYVFDGRILDQIEATMKTFHENGLCFRDAHHRNFMVTRDADGKPQGHVVDFGTAKTFEGSYRADLYEEVEAGETKKYLDDFYVVNELRRLTRTPEERAKAEEGKFLLRLEALKQKLAGNGPWKKYVSSIMQTVDAGTFDVGRAYAACPSSPDKLENFLVLLTDVLARSPELRADVSARLKALASKQTPFDQKRVQLFLE
jgi:hypothetical protein